MRTTVISLCCALLALPAVWAQQPTQEPAPAEAQPAQDEPQAPPSVDEKLEELDQKIRVLDRKIELDKTRFEGGAAAGDREDEKIFFSRFQIAF